jgi:hypothetical protein
MNADERQLITSLFERMRNHGAPEKDREAETLINQQLRANPDAAYMLVQTVLVQEQTLEAANNRVLELEEQLRSMEEGDRPRSARSGSFLGSYWGGRRDEEPRSSVPVVGSRATPSAYDSRSDGRSPWGQSGGQSGGQSAPPPQAQPAPAASSGGGFMRSALTTAAGVAGGMLVADSIRNMIGGGAHASPRHDAGSGGSRAEDAKYADERDNDPGTTEPAAYEDDGNDPGFDSGGGDSEIEI